MRKIKCRLKSGIIQMATARSVKVQLPTAGLKGRWLERKNSGKSQDKAKLFLFGLTKDQEKSETVACVRTNT